MLEDYEVYEEGPMFREHLLKFEAELKNYKHLVMMIIKNLI